LPCHQNVALTALELPWLFTNCTDTDPIELALPSVTVNGSVRMNWLPYWSEVLLWNHVLAALVSDTVRLVVCNVCPDAGVNCRTACDKSRVLEYPVIDNVKPEVVVAVPTVVITGAAGAI
jgi:hypothetical protein